MVDFSLHEIDDIKYPKRRPWLLIVLIALVFVFLWHKFGRNQKSPEKETSESTRVIPAEQVPAREDPPPVASLQVNVQPLLSKAAATAARSEENPLALAEARDLYLQALQAAIDPDTQTIIERELGGIHARLAFTPMPWPSIKVPYVVKSGDSIEKIARRFGTTIALIQLGNQVKNPHLIRKGDSFKILDGDFSIKVSTSRKDLVVYLDDVFFKRYRVGTGKFGKTPSGAFEIWDRIREPVWWRPNGKEIPFGDPENILGTRWMAIRATGDTEKVRGYGIHGTWDDSSIGKAESAGCIRLRNSDVEELYNLIPLGTEVIIEG
jgi:lipoprotein-anchoring transpeptidase ErfK/SrfK